MCEGGINVNQMQFSLEQLDETVTLGRRWTHKLFHLADEKGREEIAGELKVAQGLIDQAREHIAAAMAAVESGSDDDVTVELV